VAISGLPKVYTVSVFKGYDAHMHAVDPASNLSASPANATNTIVEALTKAIVEHRLHPGTKLAEQKLADHFGVSRTLVRQALFQLSQNRLIRLEPARGAFVAAPSALEAQQVFAVRRMLEAEMTRAFVREVTPARIKALKAHVAQEKSAIAGGDAAGRTELLGDFHVCMAELMGNDVLAQVLGDLISRCALITLMYQTASAAEHSIDEHVAIVKALAAKDEKLAVQLMDEHLLSVEESLAFNRKVPTNDISMALS
jgi:DNA-binding GntR family transcriptional regulator